MHQKATLTKRWTGLIKECQTSGLAIEDFAKQNKIGASSLYNWSKRLGLPLRGQNQSEISFIELGSIQTNVQNTELYPVEMGAGGITIKTGLPLIQIVALIKEFT